MRIASLLALAMVACGKYPNAVTIAAPTALPAVATPHAGSTTLHVTWFVRPGSDDAVVDDPFATPVPIDLDLEIDGRHQHVALAGNAAGPFTPRCDPDTATLEFFYAGRSRTFSVSRGSPGRAIVSVSESFSDGACDDSSSCEQPTPDKLAEVSVPTGVHISSRIVLVRGASTEELCTEPSADSPG